MNRTERLPLLSIGNGLHPNDAPDIPPYVVEYAKQLLASLLGNPTRLGEWEPSADHPYCDWRQIQHRPPANVVHCANRHPGLAADGQNVAHFWVPAGDYLFILDPKLSGLRNLMVEAYNNQIKSTKAKRIVQLDEPVLADFFNLYMVTDSVQWRGTDRSFHSDVFGKVSILNIPEVGSLLLGEPITHELVGDYQLGGFHPDADRIAQLKRCPEGLVKDYSGVWSVHLLYLQGSRVLRDIPSRECCFIVPSRHHQFIVSTGWRVEWLCATRLTGTTLNADGYISSVRYDQPYVTNVNAGLYLEINSSPWHVWQAWQWLTRTKPPRQAFLGPVLEEFVDIYRDLQDSPTAKREIGTQLTATSSTYGSYLGKNQRLTENTLHVMERLNLLTRPPAGSQ